MPSARTRRCALPRARCCALSPQPLLSTQASNTIKVYNNGLGIPVEVHKEEGVYVPELIFGHLLTSSNYNDKDAKACGVPAVFATC